MIQEDDANPSEAKCSTGVADQVTLAADIYSVPAVPELVMSLE